MKKYIVFLKETGFLEKPLWLIFHQQGHYVLKAIPFHLKDALFEYEEQSGNYFCYVIEKQEFENYSSIYALEDGNLTKLYQGKTLLR